MKKKTEGEIYWQGYDRGFLKAISICKKSLSGFVVVGETPQMMIKRLRSRVIPNLLAEYNAYK